MALPLIVSALSSLAPIVGKMISGDKGEEAAEHVAGIARSVAGQSDPQKAVESILKDEKHQLEFLKQMNQHEQAMVEMYLGDVQNARDMYKETGHKQADSIANGVMRWNMLFALLIGLAQIGALSYFTDLPEIVVLAIGNAAGYITKGLLDERAMVCGFYFGSSIGSKSKDTNQAR